VQLVNWLAAIAHRSSRRPPGRPDEGAASRGRRWPGGGRVASPDRRVSQPDGRRRPGFGRRVSGPVPERIRPTKVGFWYILCAVLVGVAATNTGNNALYIVLAVMLGVLVVSGVVSRFNLRGLELELAAPHEVFARRPCHLRLSVKNRSRRLPRWLLVFSPGERSQPLLVPYLPRAGGSRGFMETILPRRGRQRFPWVHVGSIFPLGLFHKGMRYRVDLDVLVYPELFPAGAAVPAGGADRNDGVRHRPGWGHELHSLRVFRQGDDPRGIHWKQTARTGDMIFTEREAEQGMRLSILFDNAVGPLATPPAQERFERLVSEAATAAVHHLGQGYEVELLARDLHLRAGSGRRQRDAILRALALLEPQPRRQEPLLTRDAGGVQLRLAMEPEEVVA
jgi:uncharacterized protein (DUF58 family)